MKRFLKTNRKSIIVATILLTIVAIAAGAFYLYSMGKFLNTSATTTITQSNLPSVDSNSQSEPSLYNTEKVTYEVLDLNKNDGDVFSIPDTIKFKINPAVEKSRATLTADTAQVLSETVAQGSSMDEIVYMNGRPNQGSSGTLKVEGIVGDKVVVTKEVKVVF